MRAERRLICSSNSDSVSEGLRGWYTGNGFEVVGDGVRYRRGGSALAWLIGKIEACGIEVNVRSTVPPTDNRSSDRVLVDLIYDFDTRLRLISRIDLLWFEAEVAALENYLETGIRSNPSLSLSGLRRVVGGAVLINVAVSTAIIVWGALMLALGPWLVVAAIVGTIIINVVSIIGFADLVVEATEEVLTFVAAKRRGSP